VIKKKNLHSIDYLRQKILSKNLKYSILRFDKEKDIQLFNNGGWHFNNLFSPKEISIKLKTFAHSEFSDKKYSSIGAIKRNIIERRDLFNRGRIYKKVILDSSYPKYILNNAENFFQFIDK
jgi:beta-1,4-mannosyl-glycoprotein beta-1,4-N-acetylglucosaminyltransferase